MPQADRCLLPIPDGISDEKAIFLADILPTGYGAVARGNPKLGDLVAVVGCGPVGLMAVLCARALAREVIAVEAVPERRALAQRLGARVVTPEEAEPAIAAASDGLGADLVIEAAGAVPALQLALRLVRGRGTVSVVGAHFEPDYPLDNARMFEREIALCFTIGDPANDRERLLAMIAAGQLDPTPIISHRLPLGQAGEAYRLFQDRQATKIILLPEEG